MTNYDTLEDLLRLAFLEGKVKTHGAYESSVAKKEPGIVATGEGKRKTLSMLEQAVLVPRAAVPVTVGELLRSTRSAQSLRAEEVFSRLGIARNIYRMLEQDRISPLKISSDVWKRMATLFDVPLENLADLIRRTHQLVFFRPSFRGTLARYDARKAKNLKKADLEKAATELFARAGLALPGDERAKIEGLITKILQ